MQEQERLVAEAEQAAALEKARKETERKKKEVSSAPLAAVQHCIRVTQ